MIPRLIVAVTGMAIMLFGGMFAYGPETRKLITTKAQVVERFMVDGGHMARYHYTVGDVTIAGQGPTRSCRECPDVIEVIYHPDDWGAAEIKGKWLPAPAIVVIAFGTMLAILGSASIFRRSNDGRSKQEHPDPKPSRNPPSGLHGGRDDGASNAGSVRVGADHDGEESRQYPTVAQHRGRGPHMPSRSQGRR